MSHIVAGKAIEKVGADKYLKYVPYALGTVAVGGVVILGGLVAKKFLDWKPTIPDLGLPSWLQDLVGETPLAPGEPGADLLVGKADFDRTLQAAYDAALAAMDASVFWDAFYEADVMVSGLLAGPLSGWWALKKIAWKIKGDKLQALIKEKQLAYEEEQRDVYQEWADQRAADEARWREQQRVLQEQHDQQIAGMYAQYAELRKTDEAAFATERQQLLDEMERRVKDLQMQYIMTGGSPPATPTVGMDFEEYTGITWDRFQDLYGNDAVDAYLHTVGVPVDASSKDYPRERLMAYNYFKGSEKDE